MREIIRIAMANGGFVTAAQVASAGIPSARLSDMVKAGELERVQRGVYCLAGEWEDEFLSAQLRFPRGVFSDGTALYLHGYTDRTPFHLTMTFSRSYRATSVRGAGIEVRTCSSDVLGVGLTILRTPYGNEVECYDLERTLCDMLRGHRVVDVQVVSPAIRRYVRGSERDLRKLLEYARLLGVEAKIRNYLEVLL